MQRQSLTGSNSWFDLDKARKFKESKFHNGSNWISRATGSQWDHEALYLTATGNWVVNHWSQWQGSIETWELIDESDATAWLIRNEHDLPSSLSDIAASSEV